GEVDDRVKGLRAGGDDYLTKPYAYTELLARIEALVRRPAPEEQTTRYSVGDLSLDRLSHKVTRAGEPIVLQPREFRLLEYLMKHAGQVVTRTMLLENVWDYHFDPQTNVIDVHISRLRGKIDKSFAKPLLHTVRGGEEGKGAARHAVGVPLPVPGGLVLIVGRDIEDLHRFAGTMGQLGLWSIVLLGALGVGAGLAVSRSVLRRIEAITETSRTIMAGNLAKRIPLAGSGDELDRLSESLNAMLERLEVLMRALGPGSDNPAHDR